VNPASWPGVVNAGFVAVLEDHVVAGLGPLLGPIALVEQLAGVRVGKAFDIDLVGDGTLAAVGAGHDAVGSPWGGPVDVGDLMGGPCQRRSEAIGEGQSGYGGVWGSARHEVAVFLVVVAGTRD
jgi:hypothetical protein